MTRTSNFTKNENRVLNSLLLFLLCFLLNPIFGLSASKNIETKSLAITQIVAHPSLDAFRKGLIDGLEKLGYSEGKNLHITFENAQGNISLAAQIAQKFVGLDPSVIVAIGTPSAQAVLSANRDSNIPLVFGAVSDPVAANLVKDPKKPDGFVTGTMDTPSTKEHLKLMKKLVPHLKHLAVLYNPGEPNSVKQVEELKTLKKDITIVEIPVSKSSDALMATRTAVAKGEAIYVPLDNVVVSVIESVVKTARTDKIPVFTSEFESVKLGALATVGSSYFDQGVQTASIVAQILEGASPKSFPIEGPKKQQVYLNASSAKKLEISFPQDLLKNATVFGKLK
ncbi:MAG: ABC transporter substrate-binding protein [Alphaproteobacteria bacterium]|nr:ABC transporter substrate-binding protein [Alphaproteobacteria bacterium]MBT5389214.1 ABC transporter substrate-binding protein [Alphaproteobacteria bacterium]MBT5540999.1 ABC transporter substrate-binding protein [Alphaproteobacteria bacterium]